MKAPEILQAKLEAERARQRLADTTAQLQDRLNPATVASNAWEGVKEKSSDLAENAADAVKARPVAVSAGLAAFTLFLARKPLRSAFARLFSSGPDEDLVTTRIDGKDRNYDITAPLTERPAREGADA